MFLAKRFTSVFLLFTLILVTAAFGKSGTFHYQAMRTAHNYLWAHQVSSRNPDLVKIVLEENYQNDSVEVEVEGLTPSENPQFEKVKIPAIVQNGNTYEYFFIRNGQVNKVQASKAKDGTYFYSKKSEVTVYPTLGPDGHCYGQPTALNMFKRQIGAHYFRTSGPRLLSVKEVAIPMVFKSNN